MFGINGILINAYESGWEDKMECVFDPAMHEIIVFGKVIQYRPEVIDEDETYFMGSRIEGADGRIYAPIPQVEYDDAIENGEDVREWLSEGVSGYVIVDEETIIDAWNL